MFHVSESAYQNKQYTCFPMQLQIQIIGKMASLYIFLLNGVCKVERLTWT